MNKTDEIKKLWSDTFGDSPEYVDMYFDRVYREADGITIDDGQRLISSLLLQRYTLWFQGRELPMAYIAGAATRRNMRGRGYMSRLMADALRESAARGDALCALIPAHDWLYFFYDQFGFSTVFYADVQRFTALHSFPTDNHYFLVDNPYSDEMYAAFARFERQRPATVLHSQRDFLNILDDLALDQGGTFVAVGRKDCGIAAMAWASLTDSGLLRVKDVFGIDADAITGALQQLRLRFPETPVLVNAPAGAQGHRHLYARGMTRIVNARMLLQAMAEANPRWHTSIRLSDHIIPDNNHTFIIDRGQCTIDDSFSGQLAFDVPIHVLNNLIFSSSRVGDVTGMPSERVHMSLMLD